MSSSPLLDNIQRWVPLTGEDRSFVESIFDRRHEPPKTLLIEQGFLARRFFYVESGSLRAYHLDERGKESTVMFAIQDWWITDMDGFMEGKAALLSVETLEKSVLRSISLPSFERLVDERPVLERFFRIVFQRAYVREQKRILDTISLPVEQRYDRFLKHYPQIVEKITQKQIASYLGVTPQFLSTVKNNSR